MNILRLFASATAAALFLLTPAIAQTSAEKLPGSSPQAFAPVANPAAIVRLHHARFTVLTPKLIRMEWAKDSQFEDHASLIFLNRNLPVPAFSREQKGRALMIDTGKLHLIYRDTEKADGFTAANLEITLTMNGKPVVWHPGTPSSGNLKGTTRTLDGAQGAEHLQEPIGPGLISRDGWVVVDDSGPLFDSSNFDFSHGDPMTQPWVLPRPSGTRQDFYFFGYGHAYRQALADYVRVAGRIPLPPRYAFGAWWSRYWAYSDQELRDLVNGFHQDNLPLDVLVIDMDWHKTFGRHFEVQDASGHRKTGKRIRNSTWEDLADFLNVETRSKSNYRAIVIVPAQTFAILGLLINPLHYALVLTCAATALRASEILALRWDDVLWDEGRIRISKRWAKGADGETKTEASDGYVPLHPLLAERLQQWHTLTPYGKTKNFVFPSLTADGKVPLSACSFVKDHLRPAAKAVGVPISDGQRFGLHNLRHSLSNWLVNKGKVEPKTVQGLLRHAKIQTTLDLCTQEDSDETRAAQGSFLSAMGMRSGMVQ